MTPVNFPQANAVFGAPPDLEDSQCERIPVFVGEVERGSVEGSRIIVAAWMPDEMDRQRISAGEPIFISVLGGLPPHFLTTEFASAIKPA